MSDRKYACYVCFQPITKEAWEAAKRQMDELSEMTSGGSFSPDDELGLIHCQGPPEQFDEEGAAIVCRSCQVGMLVAMGPDEPDLDGACLFCARWSDELQDQGHAEQCDRPKETTR